MWAAFRGGAFDTIVFTSLAQMTKSFQVGSATFGDGRLTIIAGPCVIESEEHAITMARACAKRARDAGLDFVFKSSFDKANRSSNASFRGPERTHASSARRSPSRSLSSTASSSPILDPLTLIHLSD